ncbi:predicted protein [Aspergillus nidulans FGSC A4]|uniref:Uncharacterized protein n=1 Tax=Emericella nidulans (strain FGSC A4 / ATCC 38163 / CBS 112.46 / NRRL 194 / M139) TaxID=227321 RepID=Q5B2J1_EMENI|nr:hypothetical protein [Aspergillus nidulans FGSC A4]EAA62420.1 predicted protein [Aspergillus nidulans FGSC A4]CBF81146.1 TPA: conserved hypothetical protein [Aspergillus nidulans FGSC A4]|eukprot:XP_662843.1 predicted protein [Aspergillus nidulans FGSC A4]
MPPLEMSQSTCAYIYPAAVQSYKHFIEVYLLKELSSYEPQESDTLQLAFQVQGINPVYLPDSYDRPQSTNDILQHFEGKNSKGIFVIITRTVSDPSAAPDAEPKAKQTKRTTKRQSSVRVSKVKQEPEIKQEPEVKQELEQDITVQDKNLKVVPGPAIRKKRSFSVALKEKKEPDSDTQEKDTEQESLELLFVPEEKDGVAYRTRKRHILQQEDIERSAEFGIPV